MKKLILSVSLFLSMQSFAAEVAKLNCAQLGGKLEATNCVIDEWKLFREMSDRKLVKKYKYKSKGLGMPNPAAVNCIDIGGELRTVETVAGQSADCVVKEQLLLNLVK